MYRRITEVIGLNPGKASPSRDTGMPRWIRIILIILMAYVMLSAAFSMLAPGLLFRRSEGTQKRAYVYSDIADVRKREEFRFMSGDNKLYGYFYLADEPAGTLILVNGIRSNADTHIPEILYFLGRNWSVLTFDATGIGKSEGYGYMGLQQIRLDLMALLNSPEAQPYLEGPVVLYGHSAGAYAAASVLDLGYDIKGAVCIAGFDSPLGTMMFYGRKYTGFLADLQYPFISSESRYFYGNSADVRAADSVMASDVPVLVIQGTSDDIVDMSISLYSALVDRPAAGVHLLLVDEEYRAEHSTAWNTAEAAKYLAEQHDVPDKARVNELDEEFMEFIMSFYIECIR
jgi:alpha-beta hydrolase superfamily lysophospholipase